MTHRWLRYQQPFAASSFSSFLSRSLPPFSSPSSSHPNLSFSISHPISLSSSSSLSLSSLPFFLWLHFRLPSLSPVSLESSSFYPPEFLPAAGIYSRLSLSYTTCLKIREINSSLACFCLDIICPSVHLDFVLSSFGFFLYYSCYFSFPGSLPLGPSFNFSRSSKSPGYPCWELFFFLYCYCFYFYFFKIWDLRDQLLSLYLTISRRLFQTFNWSVFDSRLVRESLPQHSIAPRLLPSWGFSHPPLPSLVWFILQNILRLPLIPVACALEVFR